MRFQFGKIWIAIKSNKFQKLSSKFPAMETHFYICMYACGTVMISYWNFVFWCNVRFLPESAICWDLIVHILCSTDTPIMETCRVGHVSCLLFRIWHVFACRVHLGVAVFVQRRPYHSRLNDLIKCQMLTSMVNMKVIVQMLWVTSWFHIRFFTIQL